MYRPPVSDQLELQLQDARLRIPWGGLDVRTLTRCAKLFSLGAPLAGGLHGDARQYTMFIHIPEESDADHDTEKENVGRAARPSRRRFSKWLELIRVIAMLDRRDG